MIKKTYIAPCMDSYEVQTICTLLAGSLTSVDVKFDDYDPENMIDLAHEFQDCPDDVMLDE